MRARLPSRAMVRAPLAVLLALAGLGHALAPERADWAEQLDRAWGGHFWTVDTTVEKKALRGLHGVLRDAASLYQDLPPEGMVDVLRKAGAKPGQRFYDLGAGPGKTVGFASMLGLNATGIELAHTRVERACEALKGLPRVGRARMLEGSFTDLDFADGDVVFFDVAKCGDLFCGPEYEQMVEGLTPTVMRLRKGAVFISTQEFLPIKPVKTVVAECHRESGDTFKARMRDRRLREKLCGMTYHLYEMPGPSATDSTRPAKRSTTAACDY